MSIINDKAWNDNLHAEVFDYFSHYPSFLLKKHFESFNEVRLLNQYTKSIKGNRFFEIGCATGELYRYISLYLPQFEYHGFDISALAINLAKKKYGNLSFSLISSIDEVAKNFGVSNVVFCRDVVIHQTEPFEFIDKLLSLSQECLVMRLRTRDVGKTILDTQLSCQRHYGKYWVPYIVLNTDEMVQRIFNCSNVKRIIISRRYEVLGGYNGRYLPKDLYYIDTKGAETAVLVELGQTPREGVVEVVYDDRTDGPVYSFFERAVHKLVRIVKGVRVPSTHPGSNS